MLKHILKKQRGLTIFELLIVMGLGLILLTALSYLMIGANRSSILRVTSELSDETARQVFSQLERNLLQAGYVDPLSNSARVGQSLNTTNNLVLARYARHKSALNAAKDNKHTFSLLGSLSNGELMPVVGCGVPFTAAANKWTCGSNDITAQQALMVSYEAIRPASDMPFTALHNAEQDKGLETGQTMLCHNISSNNSVGEVNGKHYSFFQNRFWLGVPNGETQNSVYCGSDVFALNTPGTVEKLATKNNAAGSPLTGNVEQMTFRYLVTPMNKSDAKELALDNTVSAARSIESYLQAPNVANSDLGWSGVVGVEVCIIVAVENYDNSRDQSMQTVQPDVPNCLRVNNSESAYADFIPNSPRPAGDSRMYRRYVRVLSVPNNINTPIIDL